MAKPQPSGALGGTGKTATVTKETTGKDGGGESGGGRIEKGMATSSKTELYLDKLDREVTQLSITEANPREAIAGVETTLNSA
jgi:hypothetical protein